MKRKNNPNPLPPINTVTHKFTLSEDDYIMLETLVRSPVFTSLKKLLEGYKSESTGILETNKDTHEIYKAQGRIAGIRAIENIPLLIVEWRNQSAKFEERKKLQAAIDKRLHTQDPRPPIR